jgi:hypothetical protein
MKLKGIVVVFCVFGVMQFSLAQKKIEWGAKAGFNYSSLNLSPDGKLTGTNYHPSLGYHIGGYAVIKLKKVSLQPELVYSVQGQYFSTVAYSNLKTTLNYLNVPVLVKYYLTGGLHILAGPQFGILVGSKGDLNPYSNTGLAGAPVFNQNLNSYLKSTDIALVFGAGINLPVNLNLSVRYNVGLTDINKNSGSQEYFPLQPSFSTAYTRNQVLQISVGYRIHKVGK